MYIFIKGLYSIYMNMDIFIYYNHICIPLSKVYIVFIYVFIYYNYICISLSRAYIGLPYVYILTKGFI